MEEEEILMSEESVESKIAGKQAEIDQLNRMINVSNDEAMKKIFQQEINNRQKEIEELKE